MVVHIHERRYAAQQQLGHPQLGPEHHLLGGLFRLERPDGFVEPAHERDVVRAVALERHRRMAMSVDQPGHEQFAAAVDRPHIGMRGAECLRGGGIGRNESDPVARDPHRTRKRSAVGRLGSHRQDRTIFE